MEVYQLVSILGMHTCTMGVPVLLDEMRQAGKGGELAVPLTAKQLKLKEEFTENRDIGGVVGRSLNDMPRVFEAYLRFCSIPWSPGFLEPKVKEFMYSPSMQQPRTYMNPAREFIYRMP